MPRPLRCPKCKSTDIHVKQVKCSYSAFNGYRWRRSDYSLVACNMCQWPWRTKSDQVYQLPHAAEPVWQKNSEGHWLVGRPRRDRSST